MSAINARNIAFGCWCVALGTSLGACNLLKKRQVDPLASATAAATPAPVPTPAPAPTPEPVAQVDESAVPTSEDFEDEAAEKVTTANFKAEFEQLKKDITSK